ncbi:MAG: efflux RND transporter periplasmic adaptor subunit [Haliscomenobacter sp.]|nr:efflux RND transporter periplasmic adaptor subunit [Haliscomenobacter sp.]
MKKYALIFFLGALTASCGKKDVSPEAGEAQETREIHSYILLTNAQHAQAGIETGSFSYRVMQEYFPASAELFLGTEYTAAVSAITEGIVSELRVRLNQSVRKGEVVAVLHKPGLLDWQQEYLEQKDRLVFLTAEYERYRGLAAENATAARNLQKAETDLKEAQTRMAIQAARLRQYQIDPEQVSPSNLKTQLFLRAPISGTVTKIHAGIGASLIAGTALCEIADFSGIQPVVYIFEKDIFRVKPGARVLLHFAADPSKTYAATIRDMDGAVDPDRKALRAFARFAQPVSGLIAGAYMEARIAPTAGVETAALPQDAVVREGDGEFIFFLEKEQADGFVFHKVAVRTGAADGGFLAVTPLEAVPEGAKIVVKGAYYVSAQGSGIEMEE